MPQLLSRGSRDAFVQDGDVTVEGLLDEESTVELHQAFDRVFSGDFTTGQPPDEVNWQVGRDDPTLTRQICNGWKADEVIRRNVCRADIGAAVSQLMGWPGVRLIQDNLLWKPPGARALGFHRDNDYSQWFNPNL
jgi:hypothetical protein